MLRFAISVIFLALSFPAMAQLPKTGPGYPDVMGFQTYKDNSYTHADILSNTLNTEPSAVSIHGQLTPGDVVGFNYSFTYNGTPYVRQYRHTVVAGDTQLAILTDLGNQWRSDAVVQAAIGADIVSYAWLRQATPTYWYFQFFQSWPFIQTGAPQISIYLSPGATAQGSFSMGGNVLEANPYTSCGRTTIASGRSPQVGDSLCGHYITGDAVGQPLDNRNVDPHYGQIQDTILDPTAGALKGKRTYMIDTIDFRVRQLLVNGQPAGPVGVQGPPGGNVAGSIVQSPALTVCADANQPGNNCTYTRVYKFAGLAIAGWRTIATLTPSNVSGSWAMSKMKVEAVANTNTAGFGSLESQAYIGVANGPPAGNYIGTNVCQLACPQFRFIPGANNSLQIQIASPDGVHAITSGFAKIEYMLSDAEGTPITWTIQ